RFMNRLWALVTDVIEANNGDASKNGDANTQTVAEVERLRHKMIARVGDEFVNLRFNTALAAMMEFVNGLNKAREETPEVGRDPGFAAALDTLLTLLAPMAPHITEELWHERGHNESIHRQPWPEYDPALTVDDVITIVVQVNGKLRDKLEVAADTPEEALRA